MEEYSIHNLTKPDATKPFKMGVSDKEISQTCKKTGSEKFSACLILWYMNRLFLSHCMTFLWEWITFSFPETKFLCWPLQIQAVPQSLNKGCSWLLRLFLLLCSLLMFIGNTDRMVWKMDKRRNKTLDINDALAVKTSLSRGWGMYTSMGQRAQVTFF